MRLKRNSCGGDGIFLWVVGEEAVKVEEDTEVENIE